MVGNPQAAVDALSAKPGFYHYRRRFSQFGGMVRFSWARYWAILKNPFLKDSGKALYCAQNREIHALSGNSDHFRSIILNYYVI
jgi:hypothetical protein